MAASKCSSLTKNSALASELVLPITLKPLSFAICPTSCPIAPAAAETKIVSPALGCPMPIKLPYAVNPYYYSSGQRGTQEGGEGPWTWSTSVVLGEPKHQFQHSTVPLTCMPRTPMYADNGILEFRTSGGRIVRPLVTLAGTTDRSSHLMDGLVTKVPTGNLAFRLSITSEIP